MEPGLPIVPRKPRARRMRRDIASIQQSGDFRFISPLTRIAKGDIALVAVGLVFFTIAIIGILKFGLSPENFSTLAFFALGLVSSVFTILRKLRFGAFRASRVTVTGGVAIHASRKKVGFFSLIFLGLGILQAVAYGHKAAVVLWICVFTAISGAAGIFCAITGLLIDSYLRFDPEGLTIGRPHWRALVPWGAIKRIETNQISDNPYLCLHVTNINKIDVLPDAARGKAFQFMGGGLFRCDVAIATEIYRIDLPVLAAAIALYSSDPKARKELGVRLITANRKRAGSKE